jgi:hypothetical protein
MAPIADAPYERENWQQSSASVRQPNTESDVGALAMIAADGLAPAPARPDQRAAARAARPRALACAIIESLDDDRYLRVDLDEPRRPRA